MKLSETLINRQVLAFAIFTVALVFVLGSLRPHFMHIEWIVRIQQGISPGHIWFWRIISRSVSALSFGVPLCITAWQWYRGNRNWRPLFYSMLSIGLAGTANFFAKLVFRGVRPFDVSPAVMKLSSGGSFSFPSGHSAEAFAAAVFISCWIGQPFLRGVLIVWALLIAMSRVVLGVHTPVDVLAGMAVGAAVSLIGCQLAKANNEWV